jgi:hypothetical protein
VPFTVPFVIVNPPEPVMQYNPGWKLYILVAPLRNNEFTIPGVITKLFEGPEIDTGGKPEQSGIGRLKDGT